MTELSNSPIYVHTAEEKPVFLGLDSLHSFVQSGESVPQYRPFPNFKCIFSSGGKKISKIVWPARYVGEGYYKYFLPIKRNQIITRNQLKGIY